MTYNEQIMEQFNLDDESIMKAVQLLDEESDIFRANQGLVPPVQNPSLDAIHKSIKENTSDLTLKGLSPQTQDALHLLLNNESSLKLMTKMVETKNIFEPTVRSDLLDYSHQYGTNLLKISMTEYPKGELKAADINVSLDNQQAKIKELLSYVNFKDPELKQQMETNLSLETIPEIRNQILQVDIERDMVKAAENRMRI